MINTTQLTQEQQWGLAFATQQANAAIESANETREDKQPLFTPESYAEFVMRAACDSYFAQLIDFKKQAALKTFDSLSPEEQAALVAQLQIPDALG
jgi:hypothetical protein